MTLLQIRPPSQSHLMHQNRVHVRLHALRVFLLFPRATLPCCAAEAEQIACLDA